MKSNFVKTQNDNDVDNEIENRTKKKTQHISN